MSAPRVLNYADVRQGTNTSDHTYQTARVELVDSSGRPLMAVKGSTWNLMNYCVSLKTNGVYKNNPWDIDETHSSYMTRKAKQLHKILNMIDNAPAGNENDFLLLQEIDIFLSPHPKLQVTPQQQIERYALKNQFEKNLQTRGWKMIVKVGKTQQPLAILYNAKTLQATGAPQGVFTTATHQNRGLAQEFIHLPTNSGVTLVNLHLDYAADYSQTIPQYQTQQAQLGKFTVMGGDTNHAPNQQIVGLINTWSNITNLEGDIVANNRIAITGIHQNKQNIQKCYDGFFANPTCDPANPRRNTMVKITEEEGEVFKKDAATGEYVVELLSKNPHEHLSAPGEPWRRGGYSDYLKKQSSTQTILGSMGAWIKDNPYLFLSFFLILPLIGYGLYQGIKALTSYCHTKQDRSVASSAMSNANLHARLGVGQQNNASSAAPVMSNQVVFENLPAGGNPRQFMQPQLRAQTEVDVPSALEFKAN